MSNKEVMDYLLNHMERVNSSKNTKIVVKSNPLSVIVEEPPIGERKAALFCLGAFLIGSGILSCF